MAKCKCRICGKELDSTTAYKVVIKNHNRYFCSQEEYEEHKQKREHEDTLVENIKKTSCYIMNQSFIGSTFFYKEWELWKKIAPNDIILDYLTENKERLREKVSSITSSEFARIRYLSTVLKNSLLDYQSNKTSTKQSAKIKPVTIEEYVAKYLDPNLDFKPDITMEDRIKMILGPHFENDELIAQTIRKLSYDEFLKTPYWEAITYYKRSQADFKCERCGSSTNTQTHHKTYAHHGYEHRSEVIDHDLIVLCKECHQKEHDMIDADDEI